MTIRAIFLCAALWTVALAAAAEPPPPAAANLADIRARIHSLASSLPPASATEIESEAKDDGASGVEKTEKVAAEPLAAAEAALVSKEGAEAVSAATPTDEGAEAGDSAEVPAGTGGEEATTESAMSHADEAAPPEHATEEERPVVAVPSTVCVVYPDMVQEKFRVEDWAGELVDQGAEEGVHVRNGWTLVVVRMAWDGNPRFRRVAAKGRALEIFREHHPGLPAHFKADNRILADVPGEDGTFTFVAAFRLPG